MYNIFLFGDAEKIDLFLDKVNAFKSSTKYVYILKLKITTRLIEFQFINLGDQNISTYMIDYILFTYHPDVTLQITDESNYFRYIKEIQTITNATFNVLVPVILVLVNNKSLRISSNYFFEHIYDFLGFFTLEPFKSFIFGPLYLDLQTEQVNTLQYELDLLYTYITDLYLHRTSKKSVPRFYFEKIGMNLNADRKLVPHSLETLKLLAYNDEDIGSISSFEQSDFLDFKIYKKAKKIGCQSYSDWIERHKANWDLIHVSSTPSNANVPAALQSNRLKINFDIVTIFNILVGETDQIKLFLDKIPAKVIENEKVSKVRYVINNTSVDFTLIDLETFFGAKKILVDIVSTNQPVVAFVVTNKSNYINDVKKIQHILTYQFKKVFVFLIINEDNQSRSNSEPFFETLPNIVTLEKLIIPLSFVYGPFFIDLQTDDMDIIDYNFYLLFHYVTAIRFSFIGYSVPQLQLKKIFERISLDNSNSSQPLSIPEVKNYVYGEEDLNKILEFEKSEFLDFEIFKRAKKMGFRIYKDWIESNSTLVDV